MATNNWEARVAHMSLCECPMKNSPHDEGCPMPQREREILRLLREFQEEAARIARKHNNYHTCPHGQSCTEIAAAEIESMLPAKKE